MSSKKWKPSGRHTVTLGKSFNNAMAKRQGRPIATRRPPLPLHSVRYADNYRNSKVDINSNATLTLKGAGTDNTPAEIHQPTTNSGQSAIFHGSDAPAQDNFCTLIYNVDTGSYAIEKVESSLTMKFSRVIQTSGALPRRKHEVALDADGVAASAAPKHAPLPPPPAQAHSPPRPTKKLPTAIKLQHELPPKPSTSFSTGPAPSVPPPAVRASQKRSQPEPEVEEFDLGKPSAPVPKPAPPPAAKKAKKVQPPPPPPKPPAKLELPGMNSSFRQPLSLPGSSVAPVLPPAPVAPVPAPVPVQVDDDEDEEDEDEWEEVGTAPAIPDFEPIDDDFLANELDIIPDSELPPEVEDEGEGLDDFLMGELEEEEETEVPQPPVVAGAYSSFIAGSDDEDFSSSDSEED